MAAYVRGALADPDQSQAAARFLLRDVRGRIETNPVIPDLQLDLARAIASLDLDPMRIGVTHRVADGLLHDPECGDRNVGRKQDGKSVCLH